MTGLLFSIVGYSQSKTFNWVPWKAVSAKTKADLKKIKNFNSVMEAMKIGCDVRIAIVDLDNDGNKGYAVSEEGRYCCGSLGCSFTLFEAHGNKTVDLIDKIDVIKPAKNGVISSSGKFFPLK